MLRSASGTTTTGTVVLQMQHFPIPEPASFSSGARTAERARPELVKITRRDPGLRSAWTKSPCIAADSVPPLVNVTPPGRP